MWIGGFGSTELADAVTVAYDAASGARAWAASYRGAHPLKVDVALAIAVSAGSDRVIIAGASASLEHPGRDYIAVAYDADAGPLG